MHGCEKYRGNTVGEGKRQNGLQYNITDERRIRGECYATITNRALKTIVCRVW